MKRQKKKKTLKQRVAEFEQRAVREALRKTKGNVCAAALELGVSVSSLYRKMPPECLKRVKNPNYAFSSRR